MKIAIRLYIDKSKTNRKGKSVIKCRITYNINRKEFSTGLFINPEYWDNGHQKAKPPNDENVYIDTQLSLIKSKINRAFLLLQVQEGNFTVDDIHMLYKGKKPMKEHNKSVREFFLNLSSKLLQEVNNATKIIIKYIFFILL